MCKKYGFPDKRLSNIITDLSDDTNIYINILYLECKESFNFNDIYVSKIYYKHLFKSKITIIDANKKRYNEVNFITNTGSSDTQDAIGIIDCVKKLKKMIFYDLNFENILQDKEDFFKEDREKFYQNMVQELILYT